MAVAAMDAFDADSLRWTAEVVSAKTQARGGVDEAAVSMGGEEDRRGGDEGPKVRPSPPAAHAPAEEEGAEAECTPLGDRRESATERPRDEGLAGAGDEAPPAAGKATAEAAPSRSRVPQTSFAPASASKASAAAQTVAAWQLAFYLLLARINAQVSRLPAVKTLADAFGVRPMVVVATAMLACLGFLLFGLGGNLVCTVVGVLYPGFETFKVVESEDAKATKFWLMYWVVFAAITGVEQLGYYVLIWLPFYYPLKLIMLLCLCSSSAGGATYIYTWVLSPVLLTYRDMIDEALDQSREELRSGVKRAMSEAVSIGKETGVGGMRRLQRGLSFVRPGVGTLAARCLEAAASAAAKGRTISGDAAAALVRSAASRRASWEASSDAVEAEQLAEEEPAAEPPVAGGEATPTLAEGVETPASADAAAAAPCSASAPTELASEASATVMG